MASNPQDQPVFATRERLLPPPVPSVRARLITAGLIMLMLLGMVAILVVSFGLVMQDFDE